MRLLAFLAVLVSSLFLWSGIGSAEIVQGKVIGIDPNQKSLTLNRMDAATGQPEQVQLAIDSETQFQGGIDSLSSLKVGDEISVEADQNFVTRQWKANIIQKGNEVPKAAQPAGNY